MTSQIDPAAIRQSVADFSKCVDVDIKKKLTPLMEELEQMQARLEEYQTIVSIVVNEENTTTENIGAILENRTDLLELCSRVDTIEKLVNHIKGNLNSLEFDIEKAEQLLGVADTSVTNMLMKPLFKKNPEKPTDAQEMFRCEDYFSNEES